jgi:hypothetical protein
MDAGAKPVFYNPQDVRSYAVYRLRDQWQLHRRGTGRRFTAQRGRTRLPG